MGAFIRSVVGCARDMCWTQQQPVSWSLCVCVCVYVRVRVCVCVCVFVWYVPCGNSFKLAVVGAWCEGLVLHAT